MAFTSWRERKRKKKNKKTKRKIGGERGEKICWISLVSNVLKAGLDSLAVALTSSLCFLFFFGIFFIIIGCLCNLFTKGEFINAEII